MNIYYEAAIWIGMALFAALVSVRIAVPVALVEIVVGAVAANIPGIEEHVTVVPFVTFLAGVGSILLTFLAGAEIDPVSLKRHWKASVSIGVVAATAGSDTADQLSKLADLKSQGVITDAEFETQKAKILAS
jgi:Kef-type K+ transport system membrane component KefB